MTMDRAYMVKQYVAVVKSRMGQRFRVFETGDPKYYLFDPLDANDCSGCIQFPVLKANLRADIRRMLRHGAGNSL
jgi:hypothetical protein